jgi:hypothetical protein
MFRKGIKKDSVIGVYCDTTQQKNNLLSLFADQGIKDINGIPVDKFVKVKGTM